MLVWKDCVIGAETSSEFPTDLLAPGSDIPPVYYWDHLSGTRQESTDQDFVMVPTAEMTDAEVVLAQIIMAEGIIPAKHVQAGKVIQGNKIGLVIFT
jgi:hypothetical protein